MDILLKVWNFTKTISHLSLGDYRYIYLFSFFFSVGISQYFYMRASFKTIPNSFFRVSNLRSWTEEMFTIKTRVPRRSLVYKIADYRGDELEGTFYEQELRRIFNTDSDFYRIEKVFQSRIRGIGVEYEGPLEFFSPAPQELFCTA